MDTPDARHHLDTRLIHAGEPDGGPGDPVRLPVYQSATFCTEARPEGLPTYIRLNNTPNHAALHVKLAAITGAEAAVVTASGMAAISTVLMSTLRAGDHLLIQDCLYGGTHAFLTHVAPRMGVEYDFIAGNPTSPDAWTGLLRPNTRAIYVEAVTNPMLEVADLEAVVAFARAHGLTSLIDNTFPSPANLRPLALGFDVEIHSATKALNGHSDITAGAICGGGGPLREARRLLGILGGSLDPHACFLLQRGMATLGLRVARQNENALRLAQTLADHPAVTRVIHPGLPDHPQHARAARLLDGFGGVLSFELAGGPDAADAFIDRLTLAYRAPSLGGVETLVTRPTTTSHRSVSAEARARIGLTEGLVRVSVGVEHPDDLVADFTRALSETPA
jgi:cystathionine beta-lyase/cystathionine gamma-synthase